MAQRSNAARVFHGLRALLVREDWIYVLGLLLPLAVYDVALKTSRVVGLVGTPGPLEFLDQIRSELFFDLGYAALWVGIFAVARRGVLRLFALILFHLTAAALATLATGAHYFYEVTGSVLDYDLVAFSISTWQETQAIAAAETTSMHWLLLSAVLSYTVVGPVVLARVFGSRWRLPAASSGVDRFPSVAKLLAAAVVFGALALPPSFTGESKAFARDPVANILVTEFGKLGSRGAMIEAERAAEGSPANAALAESPSTMRRNVVMVFLESTRASATTPYEEELETTTFLAELAGNSLLVENAYAIVPHTSKALVAGHCGVVPPLDTRNTEAAPGAIPARCLPELLEEQGYATAFFQSATEDFERRRMLVENLGHEDFFPAEAMPLEGFEQVNYFGYEDEVMLGPSEEWLGQRKQEDEPFLATYLTVTAHHDYAVPARYEKKIFTEDERLDRYLNAVRYQDFFLESLFEQYQELGLYEDTIFVVVGDHGEGFGEHERWQHDNTIYEEGLKIPLLIHDPKRLPGGGRVEGPANQLDLLPTLADLLGYEVVGGAYPGSPLYALPEDRTVMASCYYERRCLASVKGEEKYIYHFGDQDEEFFDLADDPLEETNIAHEEAEESKKRRKELLDWHSRVNATYQQSRQASGDETT